MPSPVAAETAQRGAAGFVRQPVVLVIVPNWNRPIDTMTCLTSLYADRYQAIEVMVVDNGSTDGSADRIAEVFPQARVLVSHRNLGYAGACNLGLRWAMAQGTDYVLLLNNDATVEPAAIGHMVDAAREEGAGIVGPKIYYRRLPAVIWSAGGYMHWGLGHPYNRGIRQVDRGQYQQRETMEWVTGCALLASMEVVRRIGLLDQSYFMFFEEIDWCFRARKAGFKVLYAPEPVVLHEGAASAPDDARRVWYEASRMRFLRKYAPRQAYLRFLLTEWREKLLQ